MTASYAYLHAVLSGGLDDAIRYAVGQIASFLVDCLAPLTHSSPAMERLPGISLLTQSTVDGLFHSPVVVNV